MNTVTVNGVLRNEVGSKYAREVRKEGKIPCVMYGGENTVHFSTTLADVKGIIYTPDFNLAEVSIDGKTHRCILKEYVMHPVTDEIQHIDFLELVDGKKVKVDIPVQFKGTSPGVKLGGKLLQKVRRVTAKLLPKDIVDVLYVDISNLDLGHSVRVRDIEAPDTIELMNPGATPVASVEIPRALRSAAAAAEKEEA